MDLRVAVIGAGIHGSRHADKFAHNPDCCLRAVVDTDLGAAQRCAERCGAIALGDYHELFGMVDAVSVVTPATTHRAIVRDCLNAGLDVLIEKPMAVDSREAAELVELAAWRDRILQVGHLERFNPVMLRLEALVHEPLFLECMRIAPYGGRGTDVDVLLDLMIHDIDLALCLIGRDIERVEAVGVPVLSDRIDIANARVHFEGGCVANFTASRISQKSERKMRFFQRDAYICADFRSREVGVFRRVAGGEGQPEIVRSGEQLDGDALQMQIDSFLECVRTRHRPKVDGAQGRRALEAALQIRAAMTSLQRVQARAVY